MEKFWSSKEQEIYNLTDDIDDEYKTLLKELSNHSKELIKKPKILCITKGDIFQESDYLDIDMPKDIKSIIISSISGYNTQHAVQEIKKILEL